MKLVLEQGAKALGAFYTDPAIADFLVGWAIRSPQTSVVDPSFGGGVFLEAATRRLQTLGGDAAAQVFGVELDAGVHGVISQDLSATLGLRSTNLVHADFFEVEPGSFGPFDAVVGNPPFIRYQSFRGEGRARALERSANQGVALSRLASSWAAFLVHSVALLRPGGRLGMVIPVELGHAAYARPVLDFLRRSFGTVTLLTFKKPLFPHLSQDTLLLLAEDRGADFEGLRLCDLNDANDLSQLSGGDRVAGARPISLEALASGKEKLVTQFIPNRAAGLYEELLASGQVARLGEVAEAGIGYVTGANAFFHLSPEEVKEWAIPRSVLRRAVYRGKALRGVSFTRDDWQGAATRGDAGYLFSAPDEAEPPDTLPDAVRRYLEHGVAEGVPKAYKCRVRASWSQVPHVYEPDAFLTYMSGLRPSLVANEAGAVAPNTLHVVRLRPGAPVGAKALSALWQTSLTCLSAELEGHALGGGMLKLEPSEARRVAVPLPVPLPSVNGELEALTKELDALGRTGEGTDGAARHHADVAVLMGLLGLNERECALLREAALCLRERRRRGR